MRRSTFLLALVLWGCPPASQVKEAPGQMATATFRHADHVGLEKQEGGGALGCGDCHHSTVENGYVAARPGSEDHAPCDTCHRQVFYAAPGAFCQVCHTDSLDVLAAKRAGAETLVEFPRRSLQAELVGAFNHALHLDEGRVRAPDGAALRCDSCHATTSGSPYVSLPNHGACASCHAPEKAAQVKAPHTLDDCAGCHVGGGPGRARRFARDNDVRFTHAKHELPCTDCHQAVVKSRTSNDRVIPQMSVCATCHADRSKTPAELRIKDNCGLCHVKDPRSGDLPGDHTGFRLVPTRWPLGLILLAQAPPSGNTASDAVPPLGDLLPSPFDPELKGETAVVPGPVLKAPAQPTPALRPTNPNVRPQDHTPLFRRRHEQAARDASAQCSQCHTGLSGSKRDACQDCHATTRPRSHTLRFRSVSHGREAAADPRACATCHEVDYCSECHAQRPPSHRGNFVLRHDRVARLNPRSCTTCHTFESTCVDCHVKSTGQDPTQTSPLRRRLRR